MKPLWKLLAGCGALAALGTAAPAVAQYYPGYGYPSGGDVVSRVLNDVLGGGYGYGYGYGLNSQMVVDECTRAVQARLGAYGGYGYGYGGGRILRIGQISPRADGGIAVRGTAISGGYRNAEVAWRCRTDGRGFIKQVTINPADSGYGYGGYGGYGYGSGYDYDYSQYGYRRY